MAHRAFLTHPLVVRTLTVSRVVDVTPRMRRITLTGPEFAAFTRDGFELIPFVSTGFDDHVKLVFASDGDIAAALPIQRAHSIDWPPAPNREARDYTVRRFDAGLGELDLEFVRHGDGPAASWAEGAAAGDTVHVVGPKSSILLPDDVDAMVLAGDETALPSIARYLEERPGDWPVHIVVEVPDAAARQPLGLRPGDTIEWVLTPPGAPSGLVAAVQALPWPQGQVYLWAAAESATLLPLRRWARIARAIPKSHLNITGYWHAVAESAADKGPEGVRVDVDALLSPVPWFATRAALQLGLLDEVAARPASVSDLARQLSLPATALATLTELLAAMDVLASDGDTVTLGRVGQTVLDDEHLRESVDDTLEAQTVLALAELAPALTEGTSSYQRAHGRTLLDDVLSDSQRYAERLEEAGGLDFVARALCDLPSATATRFVVTGPGSAAVTEALGDTAQVTVVDSPAGLEVLRGVISGTQPSFSEEFVAAEVAICALALGDRTDAQVLTLLQRATVAPRLIVVEDMASGSPASPHDAEHRLLQLAGTGTAPRSVDDIVQLAQTVGWRLCRSTPLGWNYEATEFARHS